MFWQSQLCYYCVLTASCASWASNLLQHIATRLKQHHVKHSQVRNCMLVKHSFGPQVSCTAAQCVCTQVSPGPPMVPEAQGEQYEVPQRVSALLLPRCKRLALGSANIKHVHADLPAIISRIAGQAGCKSCHDQQLQGLHEFTDVKIEHAFNGSSAS